MGKKEGRKERGRNGNAHNNGRPRNTQERKPRLEILEKKITIMFPYMVLNFRSSIKVLV